LAPRSISPVERKTVLAATHRDGAEAEELTPERPDGEFARRGHRGDVLAAAGRDPLEERSERPRRARRRPGGLDQHAAGVPAPLLGDAPVPRRSLAGLPHGFRPR
jgi:hypothetical protein